MKKMSRSIYILTALLLAAGLFAGCGKSTASEPSAGQAFNCVVSQKAKASTEKNRAENVCEEEPESGQQGCTLPDIRTFTAETLDGKEFTQDDLADYDLTVVNVWQTTCPPCIDEMPDLAELAASLPENVALITWCLDGKTENAAAGEILSEAEFKNTTIIAGDGDLNTLAVSLMYTPTTFAVDSKGNMVADALIGSPDDPQEAYSTFIDRALQEIGK